MATTMTHTVTEQAASKANQEEIKSRQSGLQKFQFVIAGLVTLFGAITSWTAVNNQRIAAENQAIATKSQGIAQQNAAKLNILTHEVARHQRFVEEIGKVTSTLSVDKEAQARISLTRLYALAQNENDKTTLLNIATASGKTSLMATMIDLIEDDPAFQNSNNSSFQENHSRVALEAAKNRLVEVVVKKEVQENNELDTPPPIVEAGLLDKLTLRDTTGWILIGKELSNEEIDSEVINIKKKKDLPSNNSVELVTKVNLRDSEPRVTGEGDIVGIVNKGSKVNIIRTLNAARTSPKKTEVWAEVKIVDKGSS